MRHGLSEEHALQALTLNGAKAMMLDDRIGSIAVGMDADLVLLDEDVKELVETIISDSWSFPALRP